jgi:hypothetical protein
MKRVRIPSAKPGELKMCWGRERRGEPPELILCYGEGAGKRDANLMHYHLCTDRPTFDPRNRFDPSFINELEARGYDITTLKFSIKKKAQPEQKDRV